MDRESNIYLKVARPLGLMTVTNDVMIAEIDFSAIWEQAAYNISETASYDKSRFDTNKAAVIRFDVGDYVLIENKARNQTKLDLKFKGSFKIIQILDHNRYLLKSLNSKRKYKYPHDKVRKIPIHEVSVELDVFQETDVNDD